MEPLEIIFRELGIEGKYDPPNSTSLMTTFMRGVSGDVRVTGVDEGGDVVFIGIEIVSDGTIRCKFYKISRDSLTAIIHLAIIADYIKQDIALLRIATSSSSSERG